MPLSTHLYVQDCDGGLYDSRLPDGPPHGRRVRPNYRWTFQRIDTASKLKATLRGGAYAWPGGYPLALATSDGGLLSFATVRDNLREVLDAVKRGDDTGGWRVVACDILWEGEHFDAHTGAPLETAYGD